MITSIGWIGVFTIICFLYMNYTTRDFFTFGLLWIVFWSHWLYYCPKMLYWFPMYFHLNCYYLKHRLISIEKSFKLMIKAPTPLSLKEIHLRYLLRRHQKMTIKIYLYNKYWNHFLRQCMVIFVPIVLFLSYLYFFTIMPTLPLIEWTIVLMANVLLVAFLLVSTSEVSNRTQITYKLLNSFCVQKSSIKMKLKVNL